LDDQALTIRIEAEDDFSPVFEQVQATLAQTRAATNDAALGFDGLDAAANHSAASLDSMQRALTESTSAARDYVRTLDSAASAMGAERFLENQALPGALRSGFAGFRQGPGIDSLASRAGVDFQGVADNLSDMTGGATAGLSGGMLSGGAGAALAVLMQNPAMRQYMGRLNDLLQELITPIVESLGPSLDALTPLMQEMRPVFVLIGETLKLNLGPLVQEMRLAFQAEQAVVAALRPVGDALVDLKSSIEGLGSGSGIGGGGGGGGPHLNIGGVQIFDAGGIVGPDAGPAPAGMPGHRLVLAQVGERLVPPGGSPASAGAAGGLSGAAASAFHFHVQASDPRHAAQEIRQVIEELIVTRRLGIA
jgi:hypothetical protein